MTEICATCHKPGSPYYAKVPGKGPGGRVSYHRYVRHLEATGRKGQTLQTSCYIGPVSQEEYEARPRRSPSKQIIESTEKPFHLSGAEIAFLKEWRGQEARMRHKTKAEFLDHLIKMGESEMTSDERKINAEMEPGPLGDYVRDRVKAES